VLISVGLDVVGFAAISYGAREIPIVFVQVVDPVAAGYVESLAHPGGNATGLTNLEFSLGSKWLELIREVAPSVRRVLVITDPLNRRDPEIRCDPNVSTHVWRRAYARAHFRPG
jgi:putative tryptophan/tyrosine transport system substrate-binding protein